MELHLRGTYRNVILIGSYAIKFPKLYPSKSFLKGCLQNISERSLWKHGEIIYDVKMNHLIAPSLYCGVLGLFQVQKRCLPNTKNLTEVEKESFKGITTDTHKHNFGYYEDRLVCFDYA
jgi:hypothetical protein